MIAGIDGCKAGWLVCTINADAVFYFEIIGSITELNKLVDSAFIDIPIGLPTSTISRPIEPILRKELGKKSASVFNAPVRQAMDFVNDYIKASKVNFDQTGKKLSKQSFNILPKIKEVDHAHDQVDIVFYESHPEFLFLYYNHAPLLYSKKTEKGIHERLKILKTSFADLAPKTYFEKAINFLEYKLFSADDLLDAMVLALTNWDTQSWGGRHQLATLCQEEIKDEKGRIMNIYFSKRP